ncbi:hypothetical protein EDWATA_00778 [Edwardsiella tarda ATCC 23685]|uniref:Uncharacterized protein n=1 Tax=Edwardsiella tarda ATCC 23685 TaxID=500638 RepID=D4F234_EDWTA|nr:hypothetical protein EDWATA_00778 [Edwardsiella tarda ATCC 23685]
MATMKKAQAGEGHMKYGTFLSANRSPRTEKCRRSTIAGR